MNKKIKNVVTILKTYMRKSLNKSDLKRWEPISEHNESWKNRTVNMSKFIQTDSSVIEFGAGRMVLKDYLPENCRYTPSDIVDRGHGTIVLDLNKMPLPKLEHYDYCIFSGVLEYINNVPKLIKHLSANIDSFIISYAIVKNGNILKRGIHGWVNNYNNEEIIKIFDDNGYTLTNESKWLNQKIYVFKKR